MKRKIQEDTSIDGGVEAKKFSFDTNIIVNLASVTLEIIKKTIAKYATITKSKNTTKISNIASNNNAININVPGSNIDINKDSLDDLVGEVRRGMDYIMRHQPTRRRVSYSDDEDEPNIPEPDNQDLDWDMMDATVPNKFDELVKAVHNLHSSNYERDASMLSRLENILIKLLDRYIPQMRQYALQEISERTNYTGNMKEAELLAVVEQSNLFKKAFKEITDVFGQYSYKFQEFLSRLDAQLTPMGNLIEISNVLQQSVADLRKSVNIQQNTINNYYEQVNRMNVSRNEPQPLPITDINPQLESFLNNLNNSITNSLANSVPQNVTNILNNFFENIPVPHAPELPITTDDSLARAIRITEERERTIEKMMHQLKQIEKKIDEGNLSKPDLPALIDPEIKIKLADLKSQIKDLGSLTNNNLSQLDTSITSTLMSNRQVMNELKLLREAVQQEFISISELKEYIADALSVNKKIQREQIIEEPQKKIDFSPPPPPPPAAQSSYIMDEDIIRADSPYSNIVINPNSSLEIKAVKRNADTAIGGNNTALVPKKRSNKALDLLRISREMDLNDSTLEVLRGLDSSANATKFLATYLMMNEENKRNYGEDLRRLYPLFSLLPVWLQNQLIKSMTYLVKKDSGNVIVNSQFLKRLVVHFQNVFNNMLYNLCNDDHTFNYIMTNFTNIVNHMQKSVIVFDGRNVVDNVYVSLLKKAMTFDSKLKKNSLSVALRFIAEKYGVYDINRDLFQVQVWSFRQFFQRFLNVNTQKNSSLYVFEQVSDNLFNALFIGDVNDFIDKIDFLEQLDAPREFIEAFVDLSVHLSENIINSAPNAYVWDIIDLREFNYFANSLLEALGGVITLDNDEMYRELIANISNDNERRYYGFSSTYKDLATILSSDSSPERVDENFKALENTNQPLAIEGTNNVIIEDSVQPSNEVAKINQSEITTEYTPELMNTDLAQNEHRAMQPTDPRRIQEGPISSNSLVFSDAGMFERIMETAEQLINTSDAVLSPENSYLLQLLRNFSTSNLNPSQQLRLRRLLDETFVRSQITPISDALSFQKMKTQYGELAKLADPIRNIPSVIIINAPPIINKEPPANTRSTITSIEELKTTINRPAELQDQNLYFEDMSDNNAKREGSGISRNKYNKSALKKLYHSKKLVPNENEPKHMQRNIKCDNCKGTSNLYYSQIADDIQCKNCIHHKRMSFKKRIPTENAKYIPIEESKHGGAYAKEEFYDFHRNNEFTSHTTFLKSAQPYFTNVENVLKQMSSIIFYLNYNDFTEYDFNCFVLLIGAVSHSAYFQNNQFALCNMHMGSLIYAKKNNIKTVKFNINEYGEDHFDNFGNFEDLRRYIQSKPSIVLTFIK